MIDTLRSIHIWLASRRNAIGDTGASLVEYALLIALIAIICIAAVGILGEETHSQLTETGSSLSNARNG